MPRPSRMGGHRWRIVTAGSTSGPEAPRCHFHLNSPQKHKGSASSGPTNSAELTTAASRRSLPGLRSTQATSRPLNSRIKPAARRRGHASAPACGDRPFRALPAFMACLSTYEWRSWEPIIRLSLLSCYHQTLESLSHLWRVILVRPERRRKQLNRLGEEKDTL